MEQEKKKLNMKIIIPVIIAIVVIAIVGIIIIKNNSNSTDSSSIYNSSITLDKNNYSNYLDISVKYVPTGNAKVRGNSVYYPEIHGNVNITGASSNFNYENVEVVLQLSGDYLVYYEETLRGGYQKQWDCKHQNLEKTVTITCNVGGSGSNTFTEDLSYGNYVTSKSIDNIYYDVVSVTGTVTPVK